jgi:DNA-binding CsgD family transcriptional regulator
MEPKSKDFENEELDSYLLMKKGDVRAKEYQYAKALPFYSAAFNLLEKNNSPVLLECANSYLKALEKCGNRAEALRVLESPNLKKLAEEGADEDRLEFKKLSLPLIWSDLSVNEFNKFTRELIQLQERVTKAHEEKSAKQIQAQYQFEKQREMEDLLRRENDILRQKEQFKKKQLYLTLSIGLLCLIVLVLLVLRFRHRAIENERRISEKERELTFQRDRRAWAEKEKDLRDQLIHQQKAELVRSMEYAEDLKSQLEQLVEEQQIEKRKELLQQLNTMQAEKTGLEFLLSQFQSVYPTFTSTLFRKYPKLSQSDVQFCTLFRMNLTTKEIAVLLHIEARSVYIKKYRVMEKMGLNEKDSFEQVLAGLES